MSQPSAPRTVHHTVTLTGTGPAPTMGEITALKIHAPEHASLSLAGKGVTGTDEADEWTATLQWDAPLVAYPSTLNSPHFGHTPQCRCISGARSLAERHPAKGAEATDERPGEHSHDDTRNTEAFGHELRRKPELPEHLQTAKERHAALGATVRRVADERANDAEFQAMKARRLAARASASEQDPSGLTDAETALDAAAYAIRMEGEDPSALLVNHPELQKKYS